MGGTGPGFLPFQVSPNPGNVPRFGALRIADQTFAVQQLAAPAFAVDFSVTPSAAPAGTPIRFSATATEPPASWCWDFGDGSGPPGGCAATAAQPAHVYAFSGTYTVVLVAVADDGDSATAVKTVTLFQSGTACASLLTPQSAGVSAGGGGGLVNVSAPADCGWTAVSQDGSFLHVVAVSVDHGSGAVTYHVDANTTGAARVGTLSLGGLVFTVSQPPCGYSFAPASAAPVDPAGGVGTVHVRTQAGCPWTAAASTPFVGLLNATGRGPGAFEYCVAANRGEDRSGEIAIAGRSIEIPQPGDRLPPGGCRATSTSLCLLGRRFEVRVAFRVPGVAQGVAASTPLDDGFGYFTFLDPKSPEILLEMVDGRPASRSFGIFYGALSNADYVVTATDTTTGDTQLYCNPNGTFRSVGDAVAFPRPSPR